MYKSLKLILFCSVFLFTGMNTLAQKYGISNKTLENGLDVIVINNPAVPLVTVEPETMVKEYFGKLPNGNYVTSYPPPVEFSEPSIKIIKKEQPTNYIQGTYSAPMRGTSEVLLMHLQQDI